ncbi:MULTISPECIES: YccS family putative transporter [unclassified Brenneria]|uniref:YccS family putative transporter n=1 Tax=unclassified Brenneria TaxID=2634434 RepID=UPI001551CD96|nr:MULTISPECIES: YccS family putative transporter [unclassified Brenneria]MBJ7221159.1 TIGR01666 family membrane protein [Brenneria sp. L3-3C-1]MEE3642401.1 YccS family putative transporter [Brenneria sp. L3_3C_1]MEE3650228.1 YccS family putative transporter [Brenneria sp. HEZEL_4_2_4]NPD00185.1 TIGR01666 family membrane protein [Brenneria sp. hezel4-2-4]
MFVFTPGIRRYIYNSSWLYNIRIFIALTGAVAVPWWLGQPTSTIPVTLGVVAAALADLDDRLTGRLRNLFITLTCFFIASVSIELLFPYPWLFGIGLALSTCGFILLGALGQRYATIAFGALLIAVYTMLGITLYNSWYQQPMMLLVGASWYNLLTLLGHLIFPIRPLQDNLAQCYQQLARYLDAKANLFDPDIEDETDKPLIEVAMVNSQLVATLNQTKSSLLTRLRGDRGQRGTRQTLHYYFVAQDIHERASSSHVYYPQLREKFRYSDILFRFQRLLSMQARACQQLAQSILLHQKYQHDSRIERAFVHLESAIARISDGAQANVSQIKALQYLLNNLRAIDAQLATIESEQTIEQESNPENTLADDKLTGWSDIRLRISRHLTPQSALFRHAVRMSVLLCSGYAFIQITGMQHGYWILLTSLFVCQPNYNATRRRLALRIIGTLTGILLGLPILYFVPSLEGQLVLIVISGVLFFAFRNVQYAHATMFITLLVLLCFNLLGEGFDVAAPRVIDTLLGCAIAWAAVSFIWPDWRFRGLPAVINKTLDANCRYLDAVMTQYHQGKDNSLTYRIARRDAHNCDAELASVISNMSSEPHITSNKMDGAFRLLCLNHTLLSYISTLGAHREKISSPAILQLLDDTVRYVDDMLHLHETDNPRINQELDAIASRIQSLSPESESKALLVLQQIGLLIELLPELTQLKNDMVKL